MSCIFLAKMNFFYTKEFKKELKRRIQIVEGSNIKNVLKNENVTTIDAYIDLIVKPEKSKKIGYSSDE